MLLLLLLLLAVRWVPLPGRDQLLPLAVRLGGGAADRRGGGATARGLGPPCGPWSRGAEASRVSTGLRYFLVSGKNGINSFSA